MRKFIYTFLMVAIMMSGCVPAAQTTQVAAAQVKKESVAPSTANPTATTLPTLPVKLTQALIPTEAKQATAAPTATKEVILPTATQAVQIPQAVGPENFPAGINPLTGLPVSDPSTLQLPPALVSVTNFPITARPQAGLSFSPFVFEMYIGEGMTRFLALFYGDYPHAGANAAAGVSATNDGIGPIRSGRLPYESIRQLFNGFLVMASASPNVKSNLNSYVNVFGSDASDINSALVPATKLREAAEKSGQPIKESDLYGLRFDPAVPQDSKPAKTIFIPWSYMNQVIWRYDATSGKYLRWQDNADGETYTQITDRLTGAPLAYSNVIVMFVEHHAKAETLIDMDLMYLDHRPALLFRDGKMTPIFWSTLSGDYARATGRQRPLHFVDAKGNAVALKPGQTWIEMMEPLTYYTETVEPGTYFDKLKKETPGSGDWVFHFYAPKIEGK